MALPKILCHVHNQYNSFHPVRHKRFEDITSLLKQERKVLKASDVFFGNTHRPCSFNGDMEAPDSSLSIIIRKQ